MSRVNTQHTFAVSRDSHENGVPHRTQARFFATIVYIYQYDTDALMVGCFSVDLLRCL